MNIIKSYNLIIKNDQYSITQKKSNLKSLQRTLALIPAYKNAIGKNSFNLDTTYLIYCHKWNKSKENT